MFVTLFDTCMVSLAALIVWRLSPFLVFFPWLTIACLDGLYLSSALTKVPNGAWFTLTLAGVLACLFILWRFGKEQQWQTEAADHFPTSHLVKKGEDGRVQLTLFQDRKSTRLNSSHLGISYAVFCLKKKKKNNKTIKDKEVNIHETASPTYVTASP